MSEKQIAPAPVDDTTHESPLPQQGRSEVVKHIASQLGETNQGALQILRRVVKYLGAEQSLAFLQQTRETEERGGLMTLDGSQRRTVGGVFFYLVKHNVPHSLRYIIFPRNAGAATAQQGDLTLQVTAQATPIATAPLSWSDRRKALEAIGNQRGTATTVKITLIGRPGKIGYSHYDVEMPSNCPVSR